MTPEERAELRRWCETIDVWKGGRLKPADLISLLDALENAEKERDELRKRLGIIIASLVKATESERDRLRKAGET